MRTNEFIKKVEELGFEVGINSGTAYILNDKTTIVRVEIDKAFAIDCFYLLNWTLEEEIREKLFDLIVEYAVTPVKDREEEKKFRLKHRWVTYSVWFLYLYRDEDGRMGVSKFTEDIEDRELGRIQIKFALKEIEEIKEKFDTDLADFELVEVEE